MPKNSVRLSIVSLIAATLVAAISPCNADAQTLPVAFELSLTYSTGYENTIPFPLTVTAGSSCSFQNVTSEVTDNPLNGQIDYHVTARVTGFLTLTSSDAFLLSCTFKLLGARQELSVGDFLFIPSTGQIFGDAIPDGFVGGAPQLELASLLYIDMPSLGHYVYHYRGNDSLFALAQQTFGVNFTGVALTFDVQPPSS